MRAFFIAALLFATTVFPGEIEPVSNVAPRLVTDPLIRATPELLKRGLWGFSSAELVVDSTGSVDSCVIDPSGNRAFDSLVMCKVTAARFTPAVHTGRPVRSNVQFEIAVPLDSLVAQCLRLPPNFEGMVIDSARRMPVPETRILLKYADTTEDGALTIGFNRYLSLIGNRDCQKYDGTVIRTVTDSLGRFAFRLLPHGHFFVSVQSAGYETGQFQSLIEGNKQTQCRFLLRPSEAQTRDSTNEIIVYGRQTFSGKTVKIADEEARIGFSPLLSNVVQAKAEIRRVPEGPSMMLVRSGCPYDNIYVVAGVPMLAPFHFGGYPYADIDGIMISALSKVNVTINDIAAKRVDASGCIVEADPGKIVYDNDSAARGFYLKGDVSYIGVDFLAAFSAKKTPGDFLQAGFSKCDDYLLKWNYRFSPSVSQGNQGIGIPLSYGNATLAGSKAVGPVRCTAFGWLAWDSYNPFKTTSEAGQKFRDTMVFYGRGATGLYPWGMGSVKFTFDSSNRSLTAGGAHQFFGTGRQINTDVISTRVFLDNGEITVDADTIIRAPFVAKLSVRISRDKWNGYLTRQGNNRVDTIFSAHGDETGAHLAPTIVKQTGRITTGMDLLASAIRYDGVARLTGDAGIAAAYEADDFHAGIHFGSVTSRPDIRGLPDPLFRMRSNRTYIASLALFVRHGMVTKIGIEPYLRYITGTPQLDPVNKIWNPDRSTPVVARGADFDFRLVPVTWADLTAVLNIAEARRLNDDGSPLAYEWSLPWTIRASLHLHTKNDRFHLYIDGIRSKGLPYFDVDMWNYAALPVYRSIDLNFQIRTRIPSQRYLNKLDCYMTLKNAQDLFRLSNVRDYYWDGNGQRQPVYLRDCRLDIGARFGFRM